MTIEPAQPCDAAAWDEYVASHPQGTPYHSCKWLDLTEAQFGHRKINLTYRSANGEIMGVLPLTRMRSTLFGKFWISLPFINFGGALAESDDVAVALMQHAAKCADTDGAAHVEFRDAKPYDGCWAARTDKVLMELPLPDSQEAFLTSIGSKLRAQAKRAQREDASIHHGGLELVPEFYAVLSENYRDLGTPVYARSFFERILKTFKEETTVSVVRLGDTAAAASLTIRHRGRTEIPWASALRKYNRFSVNMFLYAEIIKREIAAGQSLFDFGRSTIDAGTYRFKMQWGATPRQLYWHYWLKRGGTPPTLNPDNPKYALAIRAWQRLPLSISRTLGPHIVKYLP